MIFSGGIERSDSAVSFTSDQLEEEEPTYDEAPWDVTTEHPKLGVLVVATAGTLLPHTTNYKGKP